MELGRESKDLLFSRLFLCKFSWNLCGQSHLLGTNRTFTFQSFYSLYYYFREPCMKIASHVEIHLIPE